MRKVKEVRAVAQWMKGALDILPEDWGKYWQG